MKRMFLSAVLIIVICTASFSQKLVAKGKTFTAFGDYRIETMEQPIVINDKELEAFIITYQNTGLKVTLALDETPKCKKYYVLSDNLSIQYVCTDSYFGVERLDKELEKEGYKTDNENLNNDQYFHQKMISCEQNSDRTNSRLIAAYYPFLIRDQEAALALK
jgi:uncharacterized CHY-type Zn-finger protein